VKSPTNHLPRWKTLAAVAALVIYCVTISIPAHGQSETPAVLNDAQRTANKLARTRELLSANNAQSALRQADPRSSIAPPPDSEESSPLVKMLQGLAFCVGIFLIGSWAFRRFAPKRFVASPSGRRMKIVERLAISNRASLALVEIDGREVLVSLGSEGAQMLALHNRDFMLSSEQHELLENNDNHSLGGVS